MEKVPGFPSVVPWDFHQFKNHAGNCERSKSNRLCITKDVLWIFGRFVVSVSTISVQIFGMVKGSCLEEVGVCVLDGRIGKLTPGARARNLFDCISIVELGALRMSASKLMIAISNSHALFPLFPFLGRSQGQSWPDMLSLDTSLSQMLWHDKSPIIALRASVLKCIFMSQNDVDVVFGSSIEESFPAGGFLGSMAAPPASGRVRSQPGRHGC
ncbi:hypothetical protein ACH5RR_028677 [Cinchona calisaya]|uniref:Uncharacterized protein n=1 Tax=Cinchona calisaya TaxID=153742 RepID=A0ABD2YRN8_9GENT